MGSFAVLRTNVGLTTNVKVTVDGKYNLSLDSIDSAEQLSQSRYKKVKFSPTNFYDELVPFFFKDTPSDISYSIKFDEDIDTMSTDFKEQYDEIYQCGARNISSNKDYTEEFEYFAPIYIDGKSLPKNFIIFRVDGPGLQLINRSNFDFEILSKFKTVKVFDLSNSTKIGQWLELNFKNNTNFPASPLEIDFRNLEFSRWSGIDYQTGGYMTRSLFLDDYFSQEQEIFELEKFIFDSYKNNKIVFPNIINLNFLFDDEPATPDEKRKWSLNRYFGFYLDDLEKIATISPYITPLLKSDVQILENNVIESTSSQDPFVNGFSTERPFYVEYLGNFYPVQQFSEVGNQTLTQVTTGQVVNEVPQTNINTKYRIISELDLSGKQSEINKNFAYIKDGVIYNYDNTPFTIADFNSADVWLIEIMGIYHNLIEDSGQIKIISDWSFAFNANDFTYKNGGVETKVSTLVDFQNPPKNFNIFRCKFSDIKDFDTRIVDTEYSKFEYEKVNELTTTEESKMYVQDLTDNQIPKRLEDVIFKDEVENIPTSSEYTANHETFKIFRGDLSPIWRKNPIYCRWGFQNSLSANDYPYLLNNSLIFEDYNRTCNPFSSDLKRVERNLDYFYTINSSTSSYEHHTLHVEKVDDNGEIDNLFEFDLPKYLNLATYSVGTSSATYSSDYFTLFFEQNQKFINGKVKRNSIKYSTFNQGDSSIPNQTLFRGIKFSIYDVDSVSLSTDSTKINKLNLKTQNTFDGYKFSILLSDNNLSVNSNGELVDSNNLMSWSIIENWQMDKDYATGSIVVFDDILYESISQSNITMPSLFNSGRVVKSTPYNSMSWTFSSPLPGLQNWQPIFWSPNYLYQDGDLVYNGGDYYYYESSGTEDFWNPNKAGIGSSGYTLGDVVLFKNRYYYSMTSSNVYPPDYDRPSAKRVGLISVFQSFWQATQSTSPNWIPVPLWSELNTWPSGQLVVKNDVVWESLATASSTEIPGVSTFWERRYSMEPDTSFIYGTSSQLDNPIIKMNEEYYLLNSNSSNSTLDNGIIIYINKKWKNILININISDNTLFNLKNTDRDTLYNSINSKLSASNFIDAINDISSKFDFTDYVSYVIIEEDGSIKKYKLDENISSLPSYIQCEQPDEFEVKINSLIKTPISKPEKLNIRFYLKNNKISDISQLNYYSNSNIATSIEPNQSDIKVFDIYHGNKNFKSDIVYRFSGYYMPLFYEIQLFNKDFDRNLIGNYKFDTTLANFGLVKEKKFRKINRGGSILKLSNDKDFRSIYPMVDEFGLTFDDVFIFSSTWDHAYHVETFKDKQEKVIIELPSITSQIIQGFGQPVINTQNNQIL